MTGTVVVVVALPAGDVRPRLVAAPANTRLVKTSDVTETATTTETAAAIGTAPAAPTTGKLHLAGTSIYVRDSLTQIPGTVSVIPRMNAMTVTDGRTVLTAMSESVRIVTHIKSMSC